MNRVIHFGIHSADPERTAAFYREVFDWEIKAFLVPGVTLPPENRYWLVTTGADGEPGINGGTLALPKMAIKGVGWLAYAKDPAGNIFGIMQSDTSAA